MESASNTSSYGNHGMLQMELNYKETQSIKLIHQRIRILRR